MSGGEGVRGVCLCVSGVEGVYVFVWELGVCVCVGAGCVLTYEVVEDVCGVCSCVGAEGSVCVYVRVKGMVCRCLCVFV